MRQIIFLEREFTVGSMVNCFVRYERLPGGHIRFQQDIVSETGSDLGGISSHDGSKSDTESNYNTEPSIILAIFSSFNRKEQSCSYTLFKI